MNHKQHITAIAPYPIYPAKMGGQKGIALFYASFSRLVELTLISTQNNGTPHELQGEFLPILPSFKSRYFNLFLWWKINKIIKDRKSTHLIIEHPYYGWLGILLKWVTGVKLVVHSHNIEAVRFKTTGKWWWRLLWIYERYTHRHADINFFISDEDKTYAINEFNLSPTACHTITYGFDLDKCPTESDRSTARSQLCKQLNIPSDHRILFFNGTLDYNPNKDGLDNILEKILPLLEHFGLNFTIIICGKNLPQSYNELKAYKHRNVIYAGFVDDISLYFKGSDVFINPVTDGGGIKTKLVEALGYGLSCVSTTEGAFGVPQTLTQGKLIISKKEDWSDFAEKIVDISTHNTTPEAFFHHFFWEEIAAKAKLCLI